ncbi:hypothetical protein A3715_18870 [Oleiphilus sp. HI0009]|nr:hypothetical protein A3715_18870 [Oleiphilus sp. HI0009]
MLITIDGSNGAGKTTVLNEVNNYLVAKAIPHMMTREPGGTPFAEEIRKVLLSKREEHIDEMAELMLFFAARAQHVRTKIIPAIKSGELVISDRWWPASAAFQSYGRGLALEDVLKLRDLALGEFRETINIILDLCPVEGRKRIETRGDSPDRLDDDQMDFLSRARYGYLDLANREPEKFAIIDASQTKNKVISDVIKIINKHLDLQ